MYFIIVFHQKTPVTFDASSPTLIPFCPGLPSTPVPLLIASGNFPMLPFCCFCSTMKPEKKRSSPS